MGRTPLAPWVLAFMIGIVLLVFLATLSFAVGSRMLPLDKAIDGFLHPDARTIEARIIWSKRVPRTFAALLVGAALAVSGVLMQALSRNPLAEPGLLGVNSGAAASVVVGVGVLCSCGWRWLVPVWRQLWCLCWALLIPDRALIRWHAWCSRVWR